MIVRPGTTMPLDRLAEVLLRGPSMLSRGERHTVPSQSSSPTRATVQRAGRNVCAEDVAAARDAGATDIEIHDTVLIAAAFEHGYTATVHAAPCASE